MVTFSQAIDAIANADIWPGELAELQHRIVELELALRSERDSHVLYMNLYTEEMQKAVKHDRR